MILKADISNFKDYCISPAAMGNIEFKQKQANVKMQEKAVEAEA